MKNFLVGSRGSTPLRDPSTPALTATPQMREPGRKPDISPAYALREQTQQHVQNPNIPQQSPAMVGNKSSSAKGYALYSVAIFNPALSVYAVATMLGNSGHALLHAERRQTRALNWRILVRKRLRVCCVKLWTGSMTMVQL
jgi:hypothetical protein